MIDKRVASLGWAASLLFIAAPACSAPALSPAQAEQLLKGFGLRVAACNPDSAIPMSGIRTAPPVATHLVDMRAEAIPVYPVKGQFVGSCRGGDVASGRIDTFTISGVFQTGLYKDPFGEWKHTAVLRPQCEQVRTSYQMTGGPVTPAHDASTCDYTAPR